MPQVTLSGADGVVRSTRLQGMDLAAIAVDQANEGMKGIDSGIHEAHRAKDWTRQDLT